MSAIVQEVRVKNAAGLHTRPATEIVKLLQGSRSQVTFTHRHETVNARSILSLLMLMVQRDGVVTISIEGEDAQETMDRLVEIFEKEFGEAT